MNRLVSVQSWLPQEIADQVRSHCRSSGIPVSEFVRTLVLEACAMGLDAIFADHLPLCPNAISPVARS